MTTVIKNLLILSLFVLVVIFAPVLTIMSLNTIFALTIEITFWTWLAMVWLQMVTFGGLMANQKGK
jgi:hypothetical protein